MTGRPPKRRTHKSILSKTTRQQKMPRFDKKSTLLKIKRRTHKSIHKSRHYVFAEGKGAQGMCIGLKRVDRHIRDMVVRTQARFGPLFPETDQFGQQKWTIHQSFTQTCQAALNALANKLMQRVSQLALQRQMGRSKAKVPKNPRLKLLDGDLQLAWHTIVQDARD